MIEIKNTIGTNEERITRLDLYTNEEKTLTKALWIIFFANHLLDWKHFCEQVNMNIGDMFASFDPYIYTNADGVAYHKEADYYTRRWYFYSAEDNRVIDIRTWEVEVRKKAEEQAKVCHWYWYPEYLVRKHGGRLPEFRRDPIPGIRKHHRCIGLRYMRTTNERRQNADPEIQQYVRGSRKPNNLVNAYDDIWRSESRSWKDNRKVRHQWERTKKGESVAPFTSKKFMDEEWFVYTEEGDGE